MLALARLRSAPGALVTWAVAIALVVGLLVAGAVTAASVTPSFGAAVRDLDAPALLVTVTDGPDAGTPQRIADVDGVARVGTTISVTPGTVQGGGRTALPALIMGATAAEAPWFELATGTSEAPDSVAVERGFADALGIGPGSTVDVGGPEGTTRLTVTAVVRDLSRNSYPLTPQGGVYLGPAAAARIGLSGPTASATTVVPVWTSGHDLAAHTATAEDIAGTLRDTGLTPSVTALSNTLGGIGFIARLTYGAVLLFGLVALLSFAVYAAGDCRLDVRRRMRQLGALAAVGWTPGGLRRLLLLERLPALVVGGAVGAVGGLLGARQVTRHLVEMAGATPVLGGAALWTVVVLALVAICVVVAVLRGSRQLGRARIAQLLRGSAFAGRVGVRRHTPRVAGAARFGLEIVRARPARTAGTVLLVALAAAAGVFTVSARATLDDATTRPSAWGYSYDYQVSLSSSADVATAAGRARALPGVAEVREVLDSRVRLGGSGLMTPLRLLDPEQGVLTPHVVEGRMPQDPGELAVGQGVARALDLRAGDRLTLRGTLTRAVTVSGIVTELGSSGVIAYGTPELESALGTDSSRSLLVRASGDAVAGLDRLDGGDAAVTSAREQIALPFAGTLRVVLAVLAASLAVLAVVIGGSVARAAAVEQLPSLAVLTALGADGGARARTVGTVVGVLVVPALVVGAIVGVLGSPSLLSAVTAELGAMTVAVDPAATGLVVGVLAVATAASAALPLARAARRPPESFLRAAS
jgi:predicted lysophospholipase L1 biosynthesis ABC-type transport system permease subunit